MSENRQVSQGDAQLTANRQLLTAFLGPMPPPAAATKKPWKPSAASWKPSKPKSKPSATTKCMPMPWSGALSFPKCWTMRAPLPDLMWCWAIPPTYGKRSWAPSKTTSKSTTPPLPARPTCMYIL